ncbi:FadR/GntR family transcriptional regulator [Leucobacter sp. UT-8R-CII-1-4]|uniref:FadR/GntR family transcriptional regulator n=1 Tax=Leucobacter sp. UT-8R-CII-1-4 TaxID=3040075 RepID=UPI0024A8D911|nr:FadR/GntR family transcriptional regulator [Leucobacter sp. UT-8R-CII-1-4]MDI6021950.1 FadR/GntR family transcriptional regulator [Leucobacter sp. UT-8R-CII-1-4]
MEQVKRTPLADQAATLLLARIRSGEWTLGSKLPGETTLGPQLGVGRSTVREAIRQLAGQGVLESRQGAGVFVIALDIAEDWDLVLKRVDIVSALEARSAIETEAASLAATRRTPADLRHMRKALQLREQTQESIESHVDADMALHRAIVAASHNELLLELFDGFVPRIRKVMIEMLRLHPVPSEEADQDAHAQIIEAIADRNAQLAARTSRAHLDALKGMFA